MQHRKEIKEDEEKEIKFEALKTNTTKKEASKEAAKTSKKITAWLDPKTKEIVESMDWFNNMDVPNRVKYR